MKKILSLFCCVMILSLCCTALALDIEVPSLSTTLIRHRVLLSGSTDDYDEYVTVFFTDGSHVVKQFNDETRLKKSAGYTLDSVKDGLDISSIYPGFSQMAFADSRIEDKGTCISVLIRFKDLDYLANMDMMKKNGILPNVDYAYDADRLIEIMVAGGYKELDMVEYGQLGLDFEVN